jgi:hypothetical protein
MASIFTLENTDNFSEKINLDELYEAKKNNDLNQLALFQKILNRVHVRIKTTSKQKKSEPFCWFIIPEVIIGVPKYDQAACIAYIMDKLQENGFNIRYFHPNTILISWNHWVPTYVRNEIKKKTGIIVNEYGVKIDEINNNGNNSNNNKDELKLNLNFNSNELILNTKDNQQSNNNKNSKKFTPITAYKPIGNLTFE